MIHQILQVQGMTCSHCEIRIEAGVGELKGVEKAKADFAHSVVHVTYDPNLVRLEQISEAIENAGYRVADFKRGRSKEREQPREPLRVNQLLGIGIILFALYLIISQTVGFNLIPEVDQSMGYGVLFVIGLLTSLHCIAMCGGINLSQCISHPADGRKEGAGARLKPSLLYNGGRVLSYTIIGGLAGALGSVVSFSGTAKGTVAMLAGIFMVIMGINMLGIFPWLKRFNPKLPRFFGRQIYGNRGQYGSFYVGLLNGLMPCGPLQAMQIYALGTGSAAAGALSMLLFSLGTVPFMFGLGALSSILSGKFTQKMLKFSAVLVIVLGVVMVSRGFALSGLNIPVQLPTSLTVSTARLEGNVQYVTTRLEGGRYAPIVVQKGIPVKWTIQAGERDLNGCNNPMTIPQYKITKKLLPGDNLIEFTPAETGTITYTCWMGMISSSIKVVADLSQLSGAGLNDPSASGADGSMNGVTGGDSCCGVKQDW